MFTPKKITHFPFKKAQNHAEDFENTDYKTWHNESVK